jgi:nitroimidazol reductase NimA-like FMN-containing flavoprotein (pyridoxamine 5'-phosphate oxidase superfamily)
MVVHEMEQAEIERLLAEQRTVRIGFAAGEERYLIPLGYVWCEGTLCGVTTRGRKTRLAQEDPRVSFQVDTSATTGDFVWASVSGEGHFEVREEREEIVQLGRLMNARFADGPEWLRAFQVQQFAAGEMIAWCIHPSAMSGVKVIPPK